MNAANDTLTSAPRPSAFVSEVAKRARHRIARRILPFLFVLYVIAFLDRMNIGVAALPYVAAFLTQQFNGWHSDRSRERRWHAAVPLFMCGLALAFAVLGRTHLGLSIGLFVVAGGSFYGFQPVFWAVPTLFLSESAAAASIGLINAVGNLGGLAGPMVMGYLANRTHSFSPGLLYLVASLFTAGVLMLAVGRRSGWA